MRSYSSSCLAPSRTSPTFDKRTWTPCEPWRGWSFVLPRFFGSVVLVLIPNLSHIFSFTFLVAPVSCLAGPNNFKNLNLTPPCPADVELCKQPLLWCVKQMSLTAPACLLATVANVSVFEVIRDPEHILLETCNKDFRYETLVKDFFPMPFVVVVTTLSQSD